MSESRLPEAKQTPSKRSLSVSTIVLVVAIVLGFGAMVVDEYLKPGYGPFSQLSKTSESIAAARKAESDRVAAEEAAEAKREAEHRARNEAARAARQKKAEEDAFIFANATIFSRTFCPRDWEGLGPERQQRWHDIF